MGSVIDLGILRRPKSKAAQVVPLNEHSHFLYLTLFLSMNFLKGRGRVSNVVLAGNISRGYEIIFIFVLSLLKCRMNQSRENEF